MRNRRAARLPPRGEARRSKAKDRERKGDDNDRYRNPAGVHLGPPGWVTSQALPWVKIRPLPTMARMIFQRKEDSIMEHIFTIAALWLGLAVISAVVAYHLRVSIALVEICVGNH